MRLRVATLLLAASVPACTPTPEPMQMTPDARPSPPPQCQCNAIPAYSASCRGGAARTSHSCYSSASMCSVTYDRGESQCTSGCAIEGDVSLSMFDALDLPLFVDKPSVLCAETPPAQAGDPCDASGAFPCLPTRIVLNADGTVASQEYLACVQGGCVATTAPIVTDYLQRCEQLVAAQYKTAGALGAASTSNGACLIAWDDTAQAVRSGRTRFCVGHWQCPEGSLCDDTIKNLFTPSQSLAVCKPGPRGMLTPQMLSP